MDWRPLPVERTRFGRPSHFDFIGAYPDGGGGPVDLGWGGEALLGEEAGLGEEAALGEAAALEAPTLAAIGVVPGAGSFLAASVVLGGSGVLLSGFSSFFPATEVSDLAGILAGGGAFDTTARGIGSSGADLSSPGVSLPSRASCPEPGSAVSSARSTMDPGPRLTGLAPTVPKMQNRRTSAPIERSRFPALDAFAIVLEGGAFRTFERCNWELLIAEVVPPVEGDHSIFNSI
jgi:hypothetical protein